MLDNIKIWLAGAVAVGMLIPWAIKAGKRAIEKYFGEVIDHSLALDDVKDPILKGLLQKVALDVVAVAEYLVPDRGKGQEKFAKADAMMSSIPLLAGLPSLRKSLIEWACEMMWAADDTMKKRLPGNAK